MADRVMTRVPVFEPWHVAARDALRRWVPTSPAARALAAVLVAIVGTVVTAATLLVVARGDILALVTGVIGESAASAIADTAGNVVVAMFGPQVIEAVRQIGPLGIAFAAGGFVIASLATVFGLKLIATSGRARS
jgi:hypothetical protein